MFLQKILLFILEMISAITSQMLLCTGKHQVAKIIAFFKVHVFIFGTFYSDLSVYQKQSGEKIDKNM